MSQNTMRYRFTLTRMAKIKMAVSNKCWQEYEQIGTLLVVGKKKWYHNFGEQFVSFLKS